MRDADDGLTYGDDTRPFGQERGDGGFGSGSSTDQTGSSYPGADDSFGSGSSEYSYDYGYSDYEDFFMDFDPWEVEDALLDVWEYSYGYPEGEQLFDELSYDVDFNMDAYFEDLVSEYEGWYFEDDWLESPYGSYDPYSYDYNYSGYDDFFMDFDASEVEDALLDVWEYSYGYPEGEQLYEGLSEDFNMDAYLEDLVADFEGWYFEDDWLESPYGTYGSYGSYGSSASYDDPLGIEGQSLVDLTADLNTPPVAGIVAGGVADDPIGRDVDLGGFGNDSFGEDFEPTDVGPISSEAPADDSAFDIL